MPPNGDLSTDARGMSCIGLSMTARRFSTVSTSSVLKYPVRDSATAGIPCVASTSINSSAHPVTTAEQDHDVPVLRPTAHTRRVLPLSRSVIPRSGARESHGSPRRSVRASSLSARCNRLPHHLTLGMPSLCGCAGKSTSRSSVFSSCPAIRQCRKGRARMQRRVFRVRIYCPAASVMIR